MDRTNIIYGRHEEGKHIRAEQMRRLMTPMEARLWRYLRASRLDGLHFRRQQVIDGFIADFYCHGAGLVLEVDGSVHHERAEYDTLRDQIITARGLRILHVSNERIQSDLWTVLAEIRQAAKEQQQFIAVSPTDD